MQLTAQSNYHFSHTDSIEGYPAKIWQVWTDVPNWKQWDTGLKEAYLVNPFANNARGWLIPDKGPKSKFIIQDFVDGKSYTLKTKIPFGYLIVKRYLEERNGITYFTHEVEFTGILKKFFGKQLGGNYRKMLPGVMSKIKTIAQG